MGVILDKTREYGHTCRFSDTWQQAGAPLPPRWTWAYAIDLEILESISHHRDSARFRRDLLCVGCSLFSTEVCRVSNTQCPQRPQHGVTGVTLPGHVTALTSFRSIQEKENSVQVDLQYAFNVFVAETILEGPFR